MNSMAYSITCRALGTGIVSISEAEQQFSALPIAMGALCICWYNFARINSSVRMSPAMAAHLTERLWDIGDIARLEWETQA